MSETSRALLLASLLAGTTLTTAHAQLTRVNGNDQSILYSAQSTWSVEYNSRDYMGDAHVSDFANSAGHGGVKGADAVINFVGTGIGWLGEMGPDFGIAAYSIDGGPTQFFDAYDPKRRFQHKNVVIPGLPYGSHSLKVEVTQSKNNSSSGYFQAIDAFGIIGGTPLYLSDGEVAAWPNFLGNLSYSGTWACGTTDYLLGGYCWTFEPNASVSWTFDGSLVEVFGRPDFEDDVFYVVIDGQVVAQIDAQYGTVDDDAHAGYGLYQAKLDPGTHTIQLINSGPGALQIDMFAAYQ